MKRWILIVFVLSLVAIIGFLINFSPKAQVAEKKEPKVFAVKTAEIKASDVLSLNEFAGTVQSIVTMQVSTRIVAHIREIPVYAGALVKKGDLLVRLDDGDIRAKLKQAQSILDAAKAGREEATKEVARYRGLVQKRSESEQKLDQMIAKEKSAVAAVEGAMEQIREIQEMLGYTEIRSPWDGVVVEKFAELGDLASPNRILMTLQDPGKLRLEVPVSEHCARKIHVGDMVFGKIASLESEVETKVSEIVPVVDPKSRAFLVRAPLPSLTDLRPGMFGRMRFPCAPRKILLAPSSSILRQGQLDMIFVLIDGKVQMRMIRLGEQYEQGQEILAGLREGERVVLSPPETLRDGDVVKEEKA